jgi:hypothetical protein
MKTQSSKRQAGFGILEVMIAFIVIAIGVLAISGLQNSLLFNTGVAKARGEAMEVGQGVIEDIRTYISEPQFLEAVDPEALAAKYANTIQGINATYTITPTVSAPDAEKDNLRQLSVVVSWTDATGNAESVVLSSFLQFTDPVQALEQQSKKRRTILPPPSGKEGQEEDIKEKVYTDKGKFHDMGSGTGDDVYTRSYEEKGKIYTELYRMVDGEAEVLLTVYGGIIHTIDGQVVRKGDGFLDADDNPLVNLAGTSPSWCMFPVGDITTTGSNKETVHKANYVCFFGGDCYNGSEPDSLCTGQLEEGQDLTMLPGDLNGGWYGKVGLKVLGLKNPPIVCTDMDTTTKSRDPSRLYVTHRIEGNAGLAGADASLDALCTADGTYYAFKDTNGNGSLDAEEEQGLCSENAYYHLRGNEGINQGYSCHNLFISNSTNANCSTEPAENSVPVQGAVVLRMLTGTKEANPNQALPLNESWCDVIEVTGTLGTASGVDVLGVDVDGQQCAIIPGSGSSADTYRCYVMDNPWSGTISVDTHYSSGGTERTCRAAGTHTPASNVTTTPYTHNFTALTCTVDQATPTVLITGTIGGNASTGSMEVYAGATLCTLASNGNYTCEVLVDEDTSPESWTGPIYAQVNTLDKLWTSCRDYTGSLLSATYNAPSSAGNNFTCDVECACKTSNDATSATLAGGGQPAYCTAACCTDEMPANAVKGLSFLASCGVTGSPPTTAATTTTTAGATTTTTAATTTSTAATTTTTTTTTTVLYSCGCHRQNASNITWNGTQTQGGGQCTSCSNALCVSYGASKSNNTTWTETCP